MSKTISRIGDNLPGQANVQVLLREAQTYADELKATRAVIILLNEDNEEYNRVWLQAGMKYSEMIALLEITKQDALLDICSNDESN